MKWSDIMPGDMITIDHVTNPTLTELFKYDVYFIVSIKEQQNMIDVQMLFTTTTNGRFRTTFHKKHKLYRNEISSVFNIHRNGTLI